MAKQGLVVGDYIWANPVRAGEFSIPFGGKITAIEQNRVKLRDDDDVESYVSDQQIIKTMHVSSIQGCTDMINLGDLQEYSILRNLHKRYKQKQIYTYTGSLLVAINPYEVLPIYTNALIQEYQNRRLDELPPHIFAIGDNSYNNMLKNKVNQCIVISGESGAGKTESTKLLLQYLASTSGQHSWIEQQILEANPILEAFGNAKTVRNDNSSRFGKYIDIGFNRAGAIEGAKIEQYLLEKSRIVGQNEGERNYHIFYSMLAGLSKDEKKRLDLGDAKHYAYLTGGKSTTCDGRNEENEFSDIKAALKVLNFTDDETSGMFTLLAAILHLGNLNFKSGTAANTESSDVADSHLAEKIAKFLGTTKAALCEALTKKTILAHGDKVVSTLGKDKSVDSRNAFVKGIYGKLFIMIVEKINNAICVTKNPYKKIGVLDIFGFENFNVNSFEQLCINYANENLQQFFVQHIFKLEQEYYTNEGINWSNISFIDNQLILDMVGLRPLNVLALIDEESKFPNGTDFSLLTKLHGQHASNKNYMKPKSDMTPAFGIKHFAGDVFYDIPGFLDKNRDTFSIDLKNVVATSSNTMLKNIFADDLKAESTTKRMVTLSFQFKSSLDVLMKTLGSCHPFFVRCIKPNDLKKPQIFERDLCCRQLRYSGMMETAKIRQAGYPIRFTYKEFVDRFRYLGKGIPISSQGDNKDSTQKICREVFTKNEDYQCGHSKIFLKHQDLELLEQKRSKVLEIYVLAIQRSLKGWVVRKRFLDLRICALVFQKHFRAIGHRSRFLAIRNGYHRLQACIRSRVQTYQYGQMRRRVRGLQALAKGYVARRHHIFGKICGIVKQRKLDEMRLKQAGVRDYKVQAEETMQQKLSELKIVYEAKEKKRLEDREQDEEIVSKEFDFLKEYPNSPVGESPANHEFVRPKSNDSGKQYVDDLSDYNFRKFAVTYFIRNVSHQFSNKALKDSLLDLPTPDDILAAQAIWITILRWMGDMPEPSFDDVRPDDDLVLNKVRQTLSRSFTNRKEYQEILREEKKNATMKKFDRKKLLNMTLKRKSKLLDDVKRGLVEDSYAKEVYDHWLKHRRSSVLDKIHFITAHGILRPELRDEIFCQILKQLTNNYSKSSHARGWILLSLCVGCFPPSEKFEKYLTHFIREGPPGYAPFCELRLTRTIKNGSRQNPPSYLELVSCRVKAPITLSIKLLDGSQHEIECDSATTSLELVNDISKIINLTDQYGFSLYIAVYDKVMSVGANGDHVLDAISQCEQYSRERGLAEKDSPWRLFIRKEFFTPWHNPSQCAVATNLIYRQIIGGLKSGEYRCDAEADVASLIATECYVDNGTDFSATKLKTRIGEYLPTYIVKDPNVNIPQWIDRIMDAFKNLKVVKQQSPPAKGKEFIVKYAKVSWPMLFSVFYDSLQLGGPDLAKKNVIIAVNWSGIYFISDAEDILLELTYADIMFVTFEKKGEQLICKLQTVQKEEYEFHCPDADNMCKQIQYVIDGLKRRSVYCVGIEDFQHQTKAESFIEFKKGDLIVLKSGINGKNLMTSSYGYGECNNKTGDFPSDKVYILPTLTEPSPQLLAGFKKDGIMDRKQASTMNTISTVQRKRMHTLADYAAEHFRSNKRATVSRPSVLTAARKSSQDELWKYTNEPIHQPLLQRVLDNVESSRDACNMFTAILKYMGDLPAPRAKFVTEYTDLIFGPAMKDDLLKDELYCQIMRQLTFNRLTISEENGWELMYLITGLYVPSAALLSEVHKFLESRLHPLAEPCSKRLSKTQKVPPRKTPPYSIEVDAIQNRSLQTFHKVYFPDDTDEAFEIDSVSTAEDMCKSIGQRLELETLDGFSLFVVVADRVFSVPANEFFYDFLTNLMQWVKQKNPNWSSGGVTITAQYQLYFMKKLWINCTPGKNPNADHIFHYYQEFPKYTKGYHKCSKADAVTLTGLNLKVRCSSDTDAQNLLGQSLRDLIPADLYKAANANEWKKSILAEYRKLGTLSEDAAKLRFLKHIEKWPTYGSTFFEVKQQSESTYPEMVTVAINKNGVHIIHAQTKDILVTYPFSELNSWSSGNTYFHLTVGSILRKTKLLFETSQGYKMDDLITSYTLFLQEASKRDRVSRQDSTFSIF